MTSTMKTVVALVAVVFCITAAIAVKQHCNRIGAEKARTMWEATAEGARAKIARNEEELKRLGAERQSSGKVAGPGGQRPAESRETSAPDVAAIRASIEEAQRLVHVGQLVAAERYLHPFFERLGLSREQWTKHEAFLLDRLDAELEARQNIRSGPALDAALAAAKAAYEQNTRELLGPENHAALKDHERRIEAMDTPGGVLVSELANALRFTSEPLEAAQATRLTGLVQDEVQSKRTASLPVLSQTQMEEAGRILSPAQMAALRRSQLIFGPLREVDAITAQQAGGSPKRESRGTQ